MATTRLISMHKNKGKSVADCIADRIDYALNPDKTNKGEYVSSYECDPKTVKREFIISKKIYSNITGIDFLRYYKFSLYRFGITFVGRNIFTLISFIRI